MIMMKRTTIDDKDSENRGYVELLTSELDTTLHLLDKFKGKEYEMVMFSVIVIVMENIFNRRKRWRYIRNFK